MSIAPFSQPVLVDDDHPAWLPVANQGGLFQYAPLHEGCAVGWTPVDGGAVLLNFVGGGDPDRRPDRYDSVALTLSRAGLQRLIADLADVDARLEADFG